MAKSKKTGINFMIFSIIMKKSCNTMLRTGSDPADINRLRSHTGKLIPSLFVNNNQFEKT